MNWKTISAVFVIGVLMFVGAAIYAVKIRSETTQANCQAIKNLRNDMVQIFDLTRDSNKKLADINKARLTQDQLNRVNAATNNFYNTSVAILKQPKCAGGK